MTGELPRTEEMASTPSREITCARYVPVRGSRRCQRYLDGGGCVLPDEPMCIEWLKANGHVRPETRDEGVQRDLFGNPVPPPKPARSGSTKEDVPPQRREPRADAPEPPLVRNVTDEEIASFKELGAEVCLASESIGRVWLVPSYTGEDRREISVEHAATLSAICAAFPGAKVVSFEKTSRAEPGGPKPRCGGKADAL